VTAKWTNGDKTVIPRVLIVEDEPNIRELVCLHLGLEGYACEAVGDGREALKRTEGERFDLLVLDVMIPGLDGLSIVRRAGKFTPANLIGCRRSLVVWRPPFEILARHRDFCRSHGSGRRNVSSVGRTSGRRTKDMLHFS